MVYTLDKIRSRLI